MAWTVRTVVIRLAIVTLIGAAAAEAIRIGHSRHNRAGRHRRVPDPGPESGPSAFGDVRGQQQNKHKPVFDNCKNYQPEVAEEAEKGTRVIQVMASDADGIGPSGMVNYSIVSTHNKFRIDPQTGWLYTNAVFNRDEPDREKLVHVTVKASDNGRPQLEDVCTLAVKIKDINDNTPVFERANFNMPIAQDTLVGTQIMRISATDVDEGDNQKITYDLVATRIPTDIEYFKWVDVTGVVALQKRLVDKHLGYKFYLKATAKDSGNPPKLAETEIMLEVKESNKKPPSFISGPGSEIRIDESYNNFNEPVARYTAKSNYEDPTLLFHLVKGRTEKTNKDDTFKALQNGTDSVSIYLTKPLDYEKVSEYTLTLQVRNLFDLVAEAQLTIKIQDENDEAPIFNNVESGSVLEHEPPGTTVMQISATDKDGTFPANRVTYKIAKTNSKAVQDKFSINPDTGVITTTVELDREQQPVYALTIEAEDGTVSSLRKEGPNRTPQTFRIAVADKNDNPPFFPQQQYRAEVPEDQDVGSKVIEVRADDLDTEASVPTYQITDGNVGKAFSIEENTGFIRIAKPLDYEEIKKYNLVVAAWDGEFGNKTNVEITVINVNDMKPKFEKEKYVVKEEEERVPQYPIFQVKATDPDIGDSSVDQNILYYLDSKSQQASYFSVDGKTGEVRIIKPLDRDMPSGYPKWSSYIFAKDQNGGPDGIESFVPFEVVLEDKNDNAPFLNMPNGMVWPENEKPGVVGDLIADDYDTIENGPPFAFEIDRQADPEIRSKFAISKSSRGDAYVLKTLQEFDREQQKRYEIPVKICDNQNMCNVSVLQLTVGDKNDNPMRPGESEIFVYNYEGKAPDTEIGRVFVNDPDDWDLPDKTFFFKSPSQWKGSFSLNRNTGMITMDRNIKLDNDINNFILDFKVEDPTHDQVGDKAVTATVKVTIQKITREAVINSGSIRIEGTPEDVILQDENGLSKRDKLKAFLMKELNATYVDIFTVLPVGDSLTDIRFSAHGSPYYLPERIDGNVARKKTEIEQALNIKIIMVSINECLYEDTGCKGSCTSNLKIGDDLVTVYTNTTSFVGVNARPEARCECSANKLDPRSCKPNPCLNNGTCIPTGNGYTCQCPANNPNFFGPNCERLAASYNGQGWSWHPGLTTCASSHLSLIFNTQMKEGILFYAGPTPNNVISGVSDYMAAEIQNGKVHLYVNFGSDTRTVILEHKVDDSKDHYLAIRWTNDTVQMELDDKTCSNEVLHSRADCFTQINTHDMERRFLNTHGPLHVGGVSFGPESFQELARQIGVDRKKMPEGDGFVGCIKNLTFTADSKTRLYDLGSPADGDNFTPGCDAEFVQAVVALNLNMNFLIAILVCLAIILTAVIVLAVYRRKRHVFTEKDIDCDIRENIINYEDEGGGEGDQTGYDLSVLRMMADGTPALHPMGDKYKIHQEPAADIHSFLETNKDRADRNPDGTPFDDLRHYAYEGDGNSGGTLSSLNSGTSDADLEFDFLNSFGPRFKKLADMYGPDSEDDLPQSSLPHHHHHQPPPSESWC